MKIKVKIALCLLVFFCTNSFAQTTAKYETHTISTGHASLTAEIKKNGTQFEVWIYNNHPTKTYKVDFSADVTFRGKKGEFVKTVTESLTLKPDGKGYDDYPTMGWADNSSNLYYSLVGGTFSNFNWSEVSDSNKSETSLNNSADYAGKNSLSTSTFQTATDEPRYNANPQVKEAVERQNRLKTLQEKQEEQKKANYEKAIAYEQNRQESIKKSNETISAVTGAITDYIYQQEEERRKEREEEEERVAREYEQRMAEYERKVAIETKINNRKTALAEFPGKDIPLGSQEKAVRIYYFIYAYDNSINNEDGAVVYVSNVFEIGKYKDGTRVYTTVLKNEINNLTPFAEVLHGYYYTEQEAEELRQTFLSILKSNEVVIKEINYKGKSVAKSFVNESASTTPKASSSKYGKTISTGSDNLAPAKLNDATPSEVPRQNLEKAKEKESKYGKTIKLN